MEFDKYIILVKWFPLSMGLTHYTRNHLKLKCPWGDFERTLNHEIIFELTALHDH